MVCLVEAIAGTAIRDQLGLGGRRCDSRLALFHLSNYLVLRRIALAVNRNVPSTAEIRTYICLLGSDRQALCEQSVRLVRSHERAASAERARMGESSQCDRGGHSCDRRQQTRLSSRQLKTLKDYLLRLTGRVAGPCRTIVSPLASVCRELRTRIPLTQS